MGRPQGREGRTYIFQMNLSSLSTWSLLEHGLASKRLAILVLASLANLSPGTNSS